MFAMPISMPPLKRIIFHQNSPKIKLFLQKNANFFSARSFARKPPCFLRREAPPQTRKSDPIANLWLRIC